VIALLRFHLASGARVALAAAVPFAGVAVVGIGLQENPARFLEQIATSIAGRSMSWFAIAALSALAFGLASWAAPRVTLGSAGWIRHLPLSRAQHEVALIAATACAEAPLVAAALGCAVLESWRSGAIAWRGFVVPPVVAIATAALAVALRPRRRHVPRHRQTPSRVPFEVAVAWRALGARAATAWLAGMIPLAAGALFVTNNVLPDHLAGVGARLGGALGATWALAGCADALATRRPSWPWARSLPWAARRRVIGDAAILGALSAPIVVGTAALDLRAAVALAGLLPLLALRAAAAMRRGRDSRSPASGPVLVEGAFASGLVALVPWLAIAALASLPFALRSAIERERALKVTRWSAVHHVAAGDTLSWTE
jgi:hypothetical protein